MKFSLALPLIGLLWLCPSAPAADLNVPADYPTIQAALTAAAPGDTIILAPGTYQGESNLSIGISKANLTIRSENPLDQASVQGTIIDGENVAPGLVISATGSSIQGLTLINCKSSDKGAIYYAVLSGSITGTVSNCIFQGNDAASSGSGIFTQNNVTLTVESCQFDAQKTGAIFTDHSSLNLRNCTFRDNLQGSVSLHDSNGAITNCLFINNGKSNPEPVLTINNATPGYNCSINNCIFERNFSPAIKVISGTFSADNCQFVSMYPDRGIYAGSSSSGNIRNCAFRYNQGIVVYGNPNINLVNCLFYRNMSSDNCVNKAGLIQNSIFWDNYVPAGQFLINNVSSIKYCIIQGGASLITNSGTPIAVSSSNPLLTYDGHLQAGSPCINAGNSALVMPAGSVDCDGESRIYESSIDIGIDEFQDSEKDGLPDWWEIKYFGNNGGFPYWDTDNDLQNTLMEYQFGGDPFGRKIYVAVQGGNDAWDGYAPAWDGTHGPKATIQNALDSAPFDGGDITLAPGTYTGPGNRDLVFYGKRINLHSQAPSDWASVAATIIDCQGSADAPHRGVNFVYNESAHSILDGLTIINGYAPPEWYFNMFLPYGDLIYAESFTSPTIRNCILGNSRNFNAILVSNAQFDHCIFKDNQGHIACSSSNFQIDNNFRVQFSNCLFAGNKRGPILAQCYQLIVDQCSFIGNIGGPGNILSNSVKDFTLKNSIFWNNYNPPLYFFQADNQTINIHHNCIQGGKAACYFYDPIVNWQDNLETDPLFLQPGYFMDSGTPDDFYDDIWVEGDYHLRPDSPCVDAGEGTAGAGETDLDGQPRQAGMGRDLGAYEFHAFTSDINQDSFCNLVDLAILTEAWLSEPEGQGWNYRADLHTNSRIDAADLGDLAQSWLRDLRPPTPPTLIKSSRIYADRLSLQWEPASDNVQVAEYKIYRDGNLVGSTGTIGFDDSGLTPARRYSYSVSARDISGNESFPATAIATTRLVSLWFHLDIGATGVGGFASYESMNGILTVNAAGPNINDTSDQFHYAYQPLTGDGELVARVLSVSSPNEFAKAGVMIRKNLTADSPHAFAFWMPTSNPAYGISFYRRLTAGGGTTATYGPVVSAPKWLKIKRQGNLFSGYHSDDGINWTLIGSDTIEMPENVFIGVAACSRVSGTLGTMVFDNIGLD